MWCLSSAVFIAAMSVFFRERKVEPPLMPISTAVLFALPNIRNSQPGIPSTAGTTSDSASSVVHSTIQTNQSSLPVVGFFWNLLLVALVPLYNWGRRKLITAYLLSESAPSLYS